MSSLLSGSAKGQYEVLSIVGRGAQGRALLCRFLPRSQEPVQLSNDFISSPLGTTITTEPDFELVSDDSADVVVVKEYYPTRMGGLEAAVKESKLLQAHNHCCVVQYRDHWFSGVGSAGDIDDGTTINDPLDVPTGYLVMERCDGELRALLGRGPMATGLLLQLTAQLLAGLEYLHTKHIVHRDLKPENIFYVRRSESSANDATQQQTSSAAFALTSIDHFRIGDFGLSRVLESTTAFATTGCIGTMYCMAPEVLRGELHNAAADMWSLGVVLYEAFTGTKLFDPKLAVGRLAIAVCEAPIEPPLTARGHPSLPVEQRILDLVSRLMLQMLQRDPVVRISAADALKQLGSGISEVGAGGCLMLPSCCMLDATLQQAAFTLDEPNARTVLAEDQKDTRRLRNAWDKVVYNRMLPDSKVGVVKIGCEAAVFTRPTFGATLVSVLRGGAFVEVVEEMIASGADEPETEAANNEVFVCTVTDAKCKKHLEGLVPAELISLRLKTRWYKLAGDAFTPMRKRDFNWDVAEWRVRQPG